MADYRRNAFRDKRPLDKRAMQCWGDPCVAQVKAWQAAIGATTPTPLHALPSLAAAAGIGAIYVKDEGRRLGMDSFKAVGGAYAVARLLVEEAGRRLSGALELGALFLPEVARIAAQLTFVCATAGNHGRSVAAGARLVGARAIIFLPQGTSAQRTAAIAELGAEVRLVAGNYEDAVAQAALCSATEGWLLVSDTSSSRNERPTLMVMQGYTVIAEEALAQLLLPPTHVFLQAGVGGLAAAIAAYLTARLQSARPKIVIVEPEDAACLFESAGVGRPVTIAPSVATAMTVLDCRRPSSAAWWILRDATDGFMTVGDIEAEAAMQRLEAPSGGDAPIRSSLSGSCGLAGLLRAAADGELRHMLGLDSSSRVLIINTERAIDSKRNQEAVRD